MGDGFYGLIIASRHTRNHRAHVSKAVSVVAFRGIDDIAPVAFPEVPANLALVIHRTVVACISCSGGAHYSDIC